MSEASDRNENARRADMVAGAKNPWTNGLLAAVVALLGTGGLVSKEMFDELRDNSMSMRDTMAKIEAQQGTQLEWRNSVASIHRETRVAIDDIRASERALESRLVVLELAIQSLRDRARDRREPR